MPFTLAARRDPGPTAMWLGTTNSRALTAFRLGPDKKKDDFRMARARWIR